MTYTPYIPPSRAWSAPPVHAETIINVVYTDGDFDRNIRAGNANWSGEGDGPAVLGYEVVEEYREPPKPREVVAWDVVTCQGMVFPHFIRDLADASADQFGGTVVKLTGVLE